MAILFHLHLRTALSETTEDCLELIRRGLEPLLGVLEYSEALRVSLSASGPLLSRLAEGDLASLRRRVGERLEVLSSPLVDPLRGELGRDQLEASAAAWARLGVTVANGWYLPRGCERALLESGSPRTALIPARLFPDVRADIPYRLGDGSSVLLVRTERAELAARMTERRPFTLRSGDTASGIVATVVELTPQDLLPSSLSAIERRNALLELMKDLRGDFAALTILPTSLELTGESGSGPELLARIAPEAAPRSSSPQQQRAHYRSVELFEALAPLPELIRTRANEAANRERVSNAESAARTLRSGELWEAGAFSRHALRRAFATATVTAQVEIDSVIHPEVDPTHGWIEHVKRDFDQDGEEELIVDSQLKRLYFKPGAGGALIRFEYKPRKLDLCGAVGGDGRELSFVEGLLEIPDVQLVRENMERLAAQLTPLPGDVAELLVTKQTRDLFGLRVVRALGSRGLEARGSYAASLTKHYTVRAGIGAHLNNATTGFSFEYWLEAQNAPPDNLRLASRLVFSPGSGSADSVSLRPLSAFGGAADRAFALKDLPFLKSSDVEGGLYGVRLIDGIENFVMDLRSAKPLTALGVTSIADPAGTLSGVSIVFFVDAKRVYLDDKANTFFLSIL